MKAYILQTLTDLRAEQSRLSELIAVLERYGAATADDQPAATNVGPHVDHLDRINAALQEEVVVSAGRPRYYKKRAGDKRPRNVRAAAGAPAAIGTIREVIERAIAALPEPFTGGEVTSWIIDHEPAVAKSAGRSTISSTLSRLRSLDWIRELGVKKGGHEAYKRGKAFAIPCASKEAEYREFRATVPTPSPVD